MIFTAFNVNSAIVETVPPTESQQFQNEICGEKSCKFLFKKMKKFASYGNPQAQATLSLMYARGIGTEVDQERSLKYIKRAARNGLSFAEYRLGMLYRKNQMVGKYGENADYWLKRAAKKGYKPAIELLASENKITSDEVTNYVKAVKAPVNKKDTEVIVVNADKYSLSDFYEHLNDQGYGNTNQTGSRIKGGGCGNSASPCATWDINTAEGRIQYIIMLFKINS